MPKPNFFIVGAAKCGTTGMKYYLHQHPDIFMAAPTEINHFIRDFDIGPSQDEAWYLRHFEAAGDARVIGEKSVWHLFSKTAATDIKAFNPDARILIMLRNPVEMIHALHSQFLYGRNEDIKNFAHALAAVFPRGGHELHGVAPAGTVSQCHGSDCARRAGWHGRARQWLCQRQRVYRRFPQSDGGYAGEFAVSISGTVYLIHCSTFAKQWEFGLN